MSLISESYFEASQSSNFEPSQSSNFEHSQSSNFDPSQSSIFEPSQSSSLVISNRASLVISNRASLVIWARLVILASASRIIRLCRASQSWNRTRGISQRYTRMLRSLTLYFCKVQQARIQSPISWWDSGQLAGLKDGNSIERRKFH